MSKRTFGYNTTNLATAPLLLEEGIYNGILTNASVVGKENKQHINIVKESKWDKDAKAFLETGDYIIEGNIYFGVTLTDPRAIEALQRDEPKVFGGRIRLAFDKEDLTLLNNPVLGAWLEALGLHDVDFSEDVDFEYNDDIEVPEELAQVPNIIDMLNSLEFQRSMFNTICMTANNTPIRVHVNKQPQYNNKAVLENVINTGNYNDFCGILAVSAE